MENGHVINAPVLVLNQDYQPLDVCRVRRAVVLLWRGKAEVVEQNSNTVHGMSFAWTSPSVIRLVYLIHRPHHQHRLTRHEIFLRDHYTCQYCGKQTKELTIDHVIPRHMAGLHTWENVVSACKPCNYKKGGRSPKMAGMKLMRQPASPPPSSFRFGYFASDTHPEWQKYMPAFN